MPCMSKLHAVTRSVVILLRSENIRSSSGEDCKTLGSAVDSTEEFSSATFGFKIRPNNSSLFFDLSMIHLNFALHAAKIDLTQQRRWVFKNYGLAGMFPHCSPIAVLHGCLDVIDIGGKRQLHLPLYVVAFRTLYFCLHSYISNSSCIFRSQRSPASGCPCKLRSNGTTRSST